MKQQPCLLQLCFKVACFMLYKHRRRLTYELIFFPLASSYIRRQQLTEVFNGWIIQVPPQPAGNSSCLCCLCRLLLMFPLASTDFGDIILSFGAQYHCLDCTVIVRLIWKFFNRSVMWMRWSAFALHRGSITSIALVLPWPSSAFGNRFLLTWVFSSLWFCPIFHQRRRWDYIAALQTVTEPKTWEQWSCQRKWIWDSDSN